MYVTLHKALDIQATVLGQQPGTSYQALYAIKFYQTLFIPTRRTCQYFSNVPITFIPQLPVDLTQYRHQEAGPAVYYLKLP